MLGINQFPEYQVPGAVQHQFNPYEYNGGWVKYQIKVNKINLSNDDKQIL
jgi:hypothetical protein